MAFLRNCDEALELSDIQRDHCRSLCGSQLVTRPVRRISAVPGPPYPFGSVQGAVTVLAPNDHADLMSQQQGVPRPVSLISRSKPLGVAFMSRLVVQDD